MLVLNTDKSVYRPDEPVRIQLVWKNEGSSPLEVRFATTQRFELQAERDGEVIWRWSDGLFFAQVFTTLVIRPGDSRVFTAEWSGKDSQGRRVPPDRYRLRARMLGTDEAAEAAVEFAVPHVAS